MHTVGRIASIWQSFLALPTWVKLWVVLILGPVNLASVLFTDQPNGLAVLILAWGGILISALIVFWQRGITRLSGLGHIVAWTPLLPILVLHADLNTAFGVYLMLLLGVNLASLAFDINDLRRWVRGERELLP